MIKKIGFSSILILVFFMCLFTGHAVADENGEGTVDEMFDPSENNDSSESVPQGEEENSNELPGETASTGSMFFDLVKMFFALLLVLALIYLLLKFLNKRNKLFSRAKALENVGGITLGPSKSLQIIRVGSKLYLVGVGDNVELLQEITDEELKQEILSSNEEQINVNAGNLLSTLMNPKQNATKSSTDDQKKQDFKNLFASELDKLKTNRKILRNNYKQKEVNDE